MRRFAAAILAAFLAAPLVPSGVARAQVHAVVTPFCNGRLIAEQFNTLVVPGPQGRADYYVSLHNPGLQPIEYRVQVVGDVIGRPVGLMSLGPGQKTSLRLGYSLNLPGRPPLRNEQLVLATRVTCV